MKETGRITIENKPSLKGQIEKAKMVFERLAQRLDQLWQKDKLTVAEQREVQLILNNAMIVNEILEGKRPEELTGLDD